MIKIIKTLFNFSGAKTWVAIAKVAAIILLLFAIFKWVILPIWDGISDLNPGVRNDREKLTEYIKKDSITTLNILKKDSTIQWLSTDNTYLGQKIVQDSLFYNKQVIDMQTLLLSLRNNNKGLLAKIQGYEDSFPCKYKESYKTGLFKKETRWVIIPCDSIPE